MKSLAERHADRAQRKADNAAESTEAQSGGNIGAAAIALAAAHEALSALTPEQREELQAGMGSFEDDAKSVAEDNAGNLAMAGIGVINPLVVPAGKMAELGSTGVQADGALPTATFDPANGNLNGQAIEAAGNGGGNGWGTGTETATAPKETSKTAKGDAKA